MFNNFFYQFGSLSKKCVGLLAEKFSYSCQNCILLVRRIVLDEETFFLEKGIFLSVWTQSGKYFDCCWSFSCTVDKTVAKALLWLPVRTILIVSSIPRFWIRNSTLLARMFRRNCQKCNLRVHAIIWWEFDSPLENVTVLSDFLVFRQKIVSDNVWNRSARPSDLTSKSAENFSENKKNFSDELDFFLTFLDWERKNFWLPATFLRHFWQNCVLRLQSTLW